MSLLLEKAGLRETELSDTPDFWAIMHAIDKVAPRFFNELSDALEGKGEIPKQQAIELLTLLKAGELIAPKTDLHLKQEQQVFTLQSYMAKAAVRHETNMHEKDSVKPAIIQLLETKNDTRCSIGVSGSGMLASGKKGRGGARASPGDVQGKNLPRLVRLGQHCDAFVTRSSRCLGAFVEPSQRAVEPAQRKRTSHHDQHLEDAGTHAHARERHAQRLKDLSRRDAALLGELAKRALHCASGVPRLEGSEAMSRGAQHLGGGRGILPVLASGLLLVGDIGREIGRRLPDDVVHRSRANLQQIDQREIPVSPRGQVGGSTRSPPPPCSGVTSGSNSIGRRAAQVLAVHPLQLLRIEDRRLFLQPVGREQLDHLFERHHLAISPGRPAEEREEIDHRARQDPLVAVIADRGRPVSLAQLLAVEPVNHRDVRELRQLGAERAVEQDLLGRVGDVIVATHNERDAHGDVVGHDRHVVDRGAIRPQDDEVIDVLVGEGDRAVDEIVPAVSPSGTRKRTANGTPGRDAPRDLVGASRSQRRSYVKLSLLRLGRAPALVELRRRCRSTDRRHSTLSSRSTSRRWRSRFAP